MTRRLRCVWRWLWTCHVYGPFDPQVVTLWRPHPAVTVWRPKRSGFVCLSVSRFMLAAGLPLEWPSMRIVPDRVRLAGGPFALTVWRDDSDIYQEKGHP